MSEPAAGNELAEVLWENGVALRRTPPSFFPPFACSAAGTGRAAQEVVKRGGGPASSVMLRDLLAVQGDDGDEEAVPWLHCPIVDGDDCDDVTDPLPPEYCSGLLSDLAAPAALARRSAGGAPSTSQGGVVVPQPPPELAVPKQHARPSGEGVMNFTFFSRPLQRPPGGERATTSSNPVESTVVQLTATNRLRSTPLFSEQRMAWLQPPKESRTTTVAAPPPPPPAPPVPIRQTEAAASLTQRLQPEARPPQPPPPPATATTSSVCSDNGDRSQLKRSSNHHHHYHQPAEWSGSQDEDLDEDDPSALRRSAGRSTKRGRTAEVHNMSERRRRDRINEKMRALQELIPNCNKIDKASMLEEAIEYLKTLQLQVQMMSMGTPGLCVPPMMHLQMPSPMAHFHHHHHLGAIGALAAGFGMGAGAFDPRVVAAAAAGQFPCPMMPPGAPMFGMPVPSPQPPPPFLPHMANVVMNNNNATAAAAQDEQAPSDHPQAPAVPRPM